MACSVDFIADNVTSGEDVINKAKARRASSSQMRARYQYRTWFRGSRILHCDLCLEVVKDLDLALPLRGTEPGALEVVLERGRA